MSAVIRPLRGPARPASRPHEDPRWAERHSPAPPDAGSAREPVGTVGWAAFGDHRDRVLADAVLEASLSIMGAAVEMGATPDDREAMLATILDRVTAVAVETIVRSRLVRMAGV